MKVINTKIGSKFFCLRQWVLPVSLAILIYILSFFPFIIERYYSSCFYIFISDCQRIIAGWVPFSIGDILYCLVIAYLLYNLIKAVIFVFKPPFKKCFFLQGLLKTIKIFLWLYIIFNVLWGLNYNRLGIAYQLSLNEKNYTTEELKDLTCDILEKINISRVALGDSNYQYPANKTIFLQAFEAYQQTHKRFSFLDYQGFSVKPSLLSSVVSYAGYSGYYNPFSGEAQLNTDLPKFTMPFVTCHEIAHQLGYASESEANFVGYLAARYSGNDLFVYSAYFEIFMNANGELFGKDFYSAYLNLKQLNSLVKQDRRIYREYIMGNQNNVQPVISKMYDQYLKANQQKNGIKSYNEVVGWLIAYKRKYGKI